MLTPVESPLSLDLADLWLLLLFRPLVDSNAAEQHFVEN